MSGEVRVVWFPVVPLLLVCPFLPVAGGEVVEFESDAAGWLAAVQNPEAFAFDSFFPGGPSPLDCITPPVAQMQLGSLTLTVTAESGPCAVRDATAYYDASDADLASSAAVSRWEFSEPVSAFYTFYGSLAAGRTMTMTLYVGQTLVGTVSRQTGGSAVDAYGHGFISDVPVDRIEFELSGGEDHVMIGAFVGLDPQETSLGTVTIPGYSGPDGEVVELDFAFVTAPVSSTADFDGDGDVDLDDFAFFAMCYSGSGKPPPSFPAGCNAADLDGDGDVDLDDFAAFAANYTGSV